MRKLKIVLKEPKVKFTKSAGIEYTLDCMIAKADRMARNVPFYYPADADAKKSYEIFEGNCLRYEKDIKELKGRISLIRTDLKWMRRTLAEFIALKKDLLQISRYIREMEKQMKINIADFHAMNVFKLKPAGSFFNGEKLIA